VEKGMQRLALRAERWRYLGARDVLNKYRNPVIVIPAKAGIQSKNSIY
jgi:hypothetical protein